MKQPILFFVVVVCVIGGFVMMFTNFNRGSQQLLNNLATEATDIDECYDNTMTTWFEEFNANQEKGISMQEADELAAEKALLSYEDCNEVPAPQ